MATTTEPTAVQVSATTEKHRIDGVGIWNLHVMVYQEKETQLWVAQGLEIDYVSQGSSAAEARKCFEDGLVAVIGEHLKTHGDIRKLCEANIPNDIYFEMHALQQQPVLYSQVSLHVGPRPGRTATIDYLTEVQPAQKKVAA